MRFMTLSASTMSCEKRKIGLYMGPLYSLDKLNVIHLILYLYSKHKPYFFTEKMEEKMAEIVKEKRKISEKMNLEQIAKKIKSLVTMNDFIINQEFLKMFEKESNVFKNKVIYSIKFNFYKNLNFYN